jgi:hypothetical protein
MQHQPRRYPNSLGVPMELQQPPQPAHAPIPVAQEQSEQKRPRKKLGLEKLNLHTYEPDIKKVLKTMFGKEVAIDDYTGQLVFDRPNHPTATVSTT